MFARLRTNDLSSSRVPRAAPARVPRHEEQAERAVVYAAHDDDLLQRSHRGPPPRYCRYQNTVVDLREAPALQQGERPRIEEEAARAG